MSFRKGDIKLRPYDGNGLLIVISMFLTTFYIYRDFGIKTMLGWSIVMMIAIFNFLFLLRLNVRVLMSSEKCMFAFVGVMILCFWLRPSSRHDVDELLYIITMLIMILVVILCDTSLKEIKSVKTIFQVMSLLIALWILFFKVFPGIYWKTVFNIISKPCQELAEYYVSKGYGIPIGGSYTLAYYIMIIGLLFLYTELTDKSKALYSKVCSMAIMIIILGGMLAEGRRGELLAAIIALISLSFFSKNFIRLYWKLFLGAIIIGIIFLNYKYILNFMKGFAFFRRYVNTIEGFLSGYDITSGRTELWGMALTLFKSAPIFGIGFGGYAYHVTDEFRMIHGQDVMDVHNCTLQLLCENGIIGTMLILIPILFIFFNTYKLLNYVRKRSVQNEYYYWANKIGTVSLGIQIFFAIVCQLDPAFYKPIFWGFYGFSIILVYSMRKLLEYGENYNIDTLREDL